MGYSQYTLLRTYKNSIFFVFKEKKPKNIVKVSLPCHSCRGLCERGNLWEAASNSKSLLDGFRKHRFPPPHKAYVGMTCFLKPAGIKKGSATFVTLPWELDLRDD